MVWSSRIFLKDVRMNIDKFFICSYRQRDYSSQMNISPVYYTSHTIFSWLNIHWSMRGQLNQNRMKRSARQKIFSNSLLVYRLITGFRLVKIIWPVALKKFLMPSQSWCAEILVSSMTLKIDWIIGFSGHLYLFIPNVLTVVPAKEVASAVLWILVVSVFAALTECHSFWVMRCLAVTDTDCTSYGNCDAGSKSKKFHNKESLYFCWIDEKYIL